MQLGRQRRRSNTDGEVEQHWQQFFRQHHRLGLPDGCFVLEEPRAWWKDTQMAVCVWEELYWPVSIRQLVFFLELLEFDVGLCRKEGSAEKRRKVHIELFFAEIGKRQALLTSNWNGKGPLGRRNVLPTLCTWSNCGNRFLPLAARREPLKVSAG